MSEARDYIEVPPLNVKLVDSIPLPILQIEKERKRELRISFRTLTLTATSPVQNALGYDPLRVETHIDPLDFPVVLSSSTGQANDQNNGSGTVITTAPGAISQPAVPASTVAIQNTNQFAVQVVITGGTMTAVIVNGITVGAGAGTYTIPANGAISLTYTVAPTWVWTSLVASTVTSLLNPNGRVLLPSVGEYIIPGPDEVWLSAAQYPARVGFTIVREI